MLEKLKKKIIRWLRVEEKSHADYLDVQIQHLRNELHDQIKMIGINYGLQHDQTVIIFVSRLGREGGTVQIKPAYFKSVGELMDFIKFVDRSFDPNRVAIDPPFGMGSMIEEERRRRR